MEQQKPQEGIGAAGATKVDLAQAQATGLNIGIGGSGAEGQMQAAVIQLGRIADSLQEIVKQFQNGPTTPVQPFGSSQQ